MLTFSKNTSPSQKQAVMGNFNIPQSHSLEAYLGCPVFQGRPSPSTFQEMINKSAARLDRWKINSLSKAGRTVLIQSHLESLPAHTMQCFQLPRTTLCQLDNLLRTFFWKKSPSENGLPLIAWDKMCRPKSKGGLGLRNSEAVNSAFQCKLAWRLLTKDNSLWVHTMYTKYLRSTSFLDYTRKSTDSPVWRNMLRIRPLLCQGLRWKLGKGDKIRFWLDNWVDNRSLLDLLNRPIESVNKLDAKVCEFITPNKRWNLAKLSQELMHGNILKRIQGIDIPQSDMDDSICWGLHSSGQFSTKSATWLAHDTKPLNQPDWKFKWIRKLDILPKIQIFLWQIFHHALPVRGLLLRRGITIHPTCPLCSEEVESINHLFCDCIASKVVFTTAIQHKWILAGFMDARANLCAQLHDLGSQQTNCTMIQKIAFLLWNVWKQRNKVVF